MILNFSQIQFSMFQQQAFLPITPQTSLEQQLESRIAQYPQWISKFCFNPKSGFLVDDEYKLQFDYQPLHKILADLPKIIKNGELINEVNKFPQFEYNCKDYRGKIALHQAITQILNPYILKLKQSGVNQSQIAIPESLAKPLFQISNDLNIKYGMCGVAYNWYLYNKEADMEDLKIDDIRLRWYFTEQQRYQRLFFGASVIGTHFMSKIIKMAYEINQFISVSPEKQNLIAEKLIKIKGYLQKIVFQNKILLTEMDAEYFYKDLRTYLCGFDRIVLKGVETGMDKVVSSSGGNGGYDPSFQVFERAFGITYKDEYERIQTRFQDGMPYQSRNLIKWMRQNSNIRQYCSCTSYFTELFNSVIKTYVLFLKDHSAMIQNYIMKFVESSMKQHAKGVAGEKIKSIIVRYKVVQEQLIRRKYL